MGYSHLRAFTSWSRASCSQVALVLQSPCTCLTAHKAVFWLGHSGACVETPVLDHKQGTAALVSGRATAQVTPCSQVSPCVVLSLLMFAKFSSRSQLHHLQSTSNCLALPWDLLLSPLSGLQTAQDTHLLTQKVKDLIFDSIFSNTQLKTVMLESRLF